MSLLSGLRDNITFSHVFAVSVLLRVGLIIYSEWHDARSVVKYTDIDYRVFSDATKFLLHPGPGNYAEGPLAPEGIGRLARTILGL